LPDGRVELRPEGSVTLLNFFATWCKPCREEMPDFRRLRAEYDPDSLHMVSITPEVDETLIREFWEKYGGTWPVVTDPSLKATEKWDANSYPTNLLFDRNGDPTEGDSPEIRAREFSELKSLIDPLIEGSK
jgi:thiol-disulfide isomerase/thioredoxin